MVHPHHSHHLLSPFGRALTLVAGLAFLAAPLGAQGLGAGVAREARLAPTTSNATAAAEVAAGLLDLGNIQPARATAHFARALELDPSLAVARSFHATAVAGWPRAQREAELDRAVTDAAKASPAEILVVTANRARFRGEFAVARDLFAAAADLLPDDPNIAFQHAFTTGQVPGQGFSASIAPYRAVIARFPEYAPTYNLLAYGLFRIGDRAGAMANIDAYVARAPNEANAFDSRGELLAWSGKLDEALVSYKKALALDPDFTVAALGIAEVNTLMGKPDAARSAIIDVLPRVTVPATRVQFRRQLAAISFLDGDAKGTDAALMLALDEATKANDAMLAATVHMDLALTNALIGDGKAVASHAKAVGAELPAVDRAYLTALAHAFAKQPGPARTSLDELRRLVSANPTPVNSRYAPTVAAMLLVNEGKGADAVAEMNRTDLATPITRAVMALAQQAAGNQAVARSLRDEIAGDRILNLAAGPQVTARRLVKRVN